MVTFEDDDGAYLRWIKEHPEGYVLNVRRTPDPNYVVLHRASCTLITRKLAREGGYTSRGSGL